MLVKEKKSSNLKNRHTLILDFKGKVLGSTIENPNSIYSNGEEIAQFEYDVLKVNDSSIINKTLDVYFDLSRIIKNRFNDSLKDFYNQVESIEFQEAYVYDNSLQKYENRLCGRIYSSSLYKYIGSDKVLRFKINSSINYIYIKLNLSERKFKPLKITTDIKDNSTIFFQGLTLGTNYDGPNEHELLGFSKFLGTNENQIDFREGMPKNRMEIMYSAKIDNKTFGENVLCFGNSHVSDDNGSIGAIQFDIKLEKKSDINVEFYVSSEKGYDKFYISLDNNTYNRLEISGCNGNVAIDQNLDLCENLTSEKWCTYTLKGISAGDHTLTLGYIKDSSENRGKDNAFVRKITWGARETDTLRFNVPNMLMFNRNNDIYCFVKDLNTKVGQTFDIALRSGNGNVDLFVLKPDGSIMSDKSKGSIFSGSNLEISLLGSDEDTCAESLIDNIYVINSEITDSEMHDLLKGKLKGFERPRVLTGAILPNTKYKVIGSATLLNNDVVTRVVSGEFETAENENNIIIFDNSICTRN